MKTKWLVVGLGNPEGQYFNTWHNLGFVAAERMGAEFKQKGNMLIAEQDNTFIIKPLTYMNRSGEAVLAIIRKRGIKPENIIVFVDDLYIDKGKIKIVIGGGSGGHNGIKSINQLLGTPEYIKIKIGIKPQREVADFANYVLSRVPEGEKTIISEALDNATTAARMLISGEPLEIVQGKFNTRNEK